MSYNVIIKLVKHWHQSTGTSLSISYNQQRRLFASHIAMSVSRVKSLIHYCIMYCQYHSRCVNYYVPRYCFVNFHVLLTSDIVILSGALHDTQPCANQSSVDKGQLPLFLSMFVEGVQKASSRQPHEH